MVVAVAFLLDEDLASNLAKDSPHFTEMVSDFLTGLKLLVVHGQPLILISRISPLCVCSYTNTLLRLFPSGLHQR